MTRTLPPRKKLLAFFQQNQMEATTAQLMAAAEFDDRKAVMAQFRMLKIMDYYPICIQEPDEKHEEKWRLLDEYEYEQYADKQDKKKALLKKRKGKKAFANMHNRLQGMTDRIDRALDRCDKVAKLMSKKPTKLNELKLKKANIEFSIAQEEQRELRIKVAEALDVTISDLDQIEDADEYYERKFLS